MRTGRSNWLRDTQRKRRQTTPGHTHSVPVYPLKDRPLETQDSSHRLSSLLCRLSDFVDHSLAQYHQPSCQATMLDPSVVCYPPPALPRSSNPSVQLIYKNPGTPHISFHPRVHRPVYNLDRIPFYASVSKKPPRDLQTLDARGQSNFPP